MPKRYAPKKGAACHIPNTEEDFWSLVDMQGEDECWQWCGSIRKDGRGQFKFDGVTERCARLAAKFTGVAVSLDQEVFQVCSQPLCTNPQHLAVGTHKTQMNRTQVTAKMSKWHSQKVLSPSHRANIGASRKGTPCTPETRAKIGATRKARKAIKNSMTMGIGPHDYTNNYSSEVLGER